MEKQLVKFERDAGGNMTFAPFMANGKKYRFIKPGDSIGIRKWQEYEKLKIVSGTGRTFAEIVAALKEISLLAASDKDFSEIRAELIVTVDSLRKSILDLSKERYSKFFYLCTIFIYQDGKDPMEWDMDTATEMIDDWETEGIDEQDLLFFSLMLIPGWQATFKELQEKAEKEAERLSGIFSLTVRR